MRAGRESKPQEFRLSTRTAPLGVRTIAQSSVSNASALASAEIDVALALESRVAALEPETPFRILVLGDFGGRLTAPMPVDRDDLDLLLSQSIVEVPHPLGTIRINALEDFHPDRIYATSPIFERFRRVRGKLRDGAPFTGATEGLTAASPARETDALAQLDTAIGAIMRGVLHHPSFQAVESAWRSLGLLVRGLETGESLRVCPMQCLKTGLSHVRTLPGDPPWAAVSGLFRFEKTEADAALLLQMGGAARAGHASFLAETDVDEPADANSFAAWQALRHSPEARSVGLALPRFLLRLPYGKDTSAIDSFEFEEMSSPPQHGDHLWGNPSILCALLLGQAFSAHGWRMRPGIYTQVDGLPLHSYQHNGETVTQRSAEILLTDKAAGFMLSQGLMPLVCSKLVCSKNEDRVKVPRFQSIADPPAPLAGRW